MTSLRSAWLYRGCLALATLLAACSSPRDATPLPEPPALDPGKIRRGPIALATAGFITLEGDAGAVPASATVSVTNLDSRLPPQLATAAEDGSFQLSMAAQDGDELRLQVVLDGVRGVPWDVRLQGSLEPVTRLDCLRLEPGVEALFEGGDAAVSFVNACTSAISLSNPRARLARPEFSLSTELPLSIQPDREATLNWTLAASQAGAQEDSSFVDVNADGQVLRYSVTLVP